MNYLSNEALDHQHHLDQYRWALTGNPANDDYFTAQAAETHALVVIDAVGDLPVRAVMEGEHWTGDLYAHLVYGVARRASDIWSAARDLVSISPVSRDKPLSMEQAALISRALNTIYINIRGVLDNFAWAAIEQAGGLAALKLTYSQVDLFGSKFSKVPAFGNLPDQLKPLAAWSADLAERRNPAAHRIPLAVVPAIVDDAQHAEIKRLMSEMLTLPTDGRTAGDFERLAERQDAIKQKIARIGAYRPMFAHMPSDGAMPIYPTVAQDIGQMVIAGRIVLRYLAGHREP